MTTFSPKLQPALAAIRKRWGTQALLAGAEMYGDRAAVPTGFAVLDGLLGGGIPRGRLTEVRGRPGGGAHSLALAIAAQAQSGSELVAYLDLGASFDAEYAVFCGVDPEHLLLVRPAGVREALAIVHALLQGGDAGAIVVDSFNHLAADAAAARELGEAVTRWAALSGRTRCALLGVVDEAGDAARYFGSGSPLAHAAALRLSVARRGWIEQAGLFTSQAHAAGTISEVTVLAQAGQAAPRSATVTFALPGT